MHRKQLENIITETLVNIGFYSPEATQLILCTAAHESNLGEYIRQFPQGPALGIFQIERVTFNDILNRFLARRTELTDKIRQECNCFALVPDAMVYNLKLAVTFCRLKYYLCPGVLPSIGDFKAVAEYWKQHYNTTLGKGTVEGFLKSLKKHAIL